METPAKSKPMVSRPMSRDEVHLLVDLIAKKEAIFSKETNAKKNKEKDECWEYISTYFNATTGIPRTKEQIKAKWDNLKKAARKRNERIRLNKLKTGGGKPDYIPLDETLEKVASLMGSTCDGFEVAFGGDGVIPTQTEREQSREIICEEFILDTEDKENTPSSTEANTCEQENTPSKIRKLDNIGAYAKLAPAKGKKKQLSDKNGRLERNLAIARYYEKKNAKLDMETKKLELEMQLLKKQLSNKDEE